MSDNSIGPIGPAQPISSDSNSSSANEQAFKKGYGSVLKQLEGASVGDLEPQPINVSGNFLLDAINAATIMQNSVQDSYVQDANIASAVQTSSTDVANAFKNILTQDVADEQGLSGDNLTKAQSQFTVDNTKFQQSQSEMQGLTQTAQQTASQESQNLQQQSQMYSNLMSVVNNISQAMGGLS